VTPNPTVACTRAPAKTPAGASALRAKHWAKYRQVWIERVGCLALLCSLGPDLAAAAPPSPPDSGFAEPPTGPTATTEPGSPSPASDPRLAAPVLVRVLPSDERVVARLRAELALLDLSVLVDEPGDDATALGPELLEQLPRAQASAAIEIVVGDTRIDLWVADGATGKTLHRRLDLESDPDPREPRTLAITAIELLRASRLEVVEIVEPSPPPAEADPSDDPNLRPDPPPRSPTLQSTGALSLAPMVGGSPGGFRVTTHVELAGRWVPLPRFALRVSAWIPTVGNSVPVTDGRVRMFVGMAFIEPQLRLPGGVAWLHPVLGLGLGAAVVGFEGIADEGLRSETRVLAGFAGHTHLGLGFAVIPRLWIRVDGYLGTVQPRPQIRSATGQVEATWGLPFATGSLGIEIWL
jgi:hypothetical protein